MANVIGQLLVELGVNTAHMKEGFDKGTYMAKQFSDQVKASFSELGNSVKEFASEFGGVGGALGETLGPLTQALSPLISSLGTAGGATAGLAAALPAVGLAALGVAVHFSETAAKLQDLSEATGIGVEQLSLLGNVAATHGISVDQMGKALERMGRSAVQAAKAGPQATNVYRDLGVEVKNTDGTMRESADIFNDVSAKLAAMPDGAVKTADAIKLFGRAGAELIPILNEGGSKLAVLEGHFTALNAVVSGSTAKASEELKQNMTLMGAAFTGVENELTKDLVPALNEVAEEFIAAFEGKQDIIKSVVDSIAFVAKSLLELVQVAALVGDAFVNMVEFIQGILAGLGDVIRGAATAAFDIKEGNFKAAWTDFKSAGIEAYGTIVQTSKASWAQMKNDATSTAADIMKLWSAQAPNVAKPTEKQPEVNPAPDTSFVTKAVQSADQSADKMERLATAIGHVGAAEIEAAAAAQSNLEIEKLRDEAVDKGIQNTSGFRAALASAIPQLQQAALWTETFKAALSADKEFKSFDEHLNKEKQSFEDAASAGDAYEREQAKLSAGMAPLSKKIAELTEEYFNLATAPGANPAKVAELHNAIVTLNAELENEKTKVAAVTAAWSASQAKAQLDKINASTQDLRDENALLLSSNPYAKLEADAKKFQDAIHATPAEIAAATAALKNEEQQMAKMAAIKTAQSLGFDPAAVTNLENERAALVAMWNAGTISAQEYSTTLLKINADIDQMNAKQGGFFAGAKAGFSQWESSVTTAGMFMQKEITTALDGITDNFAQMVETGKANWASLEQSMESQMLKFAASTVLKDALKAISGALSGQGGFLGAIGGMLGGGQSSGAAQAAATTANTTALAANTAALAANSAAVSTAALKSSLDMGGGGGDGSGGGSLLSGLFDSLDNGGGMATGGSVMPGKYYTVGEHGPETLVPGSSGTIIPNGGGGGNVTVVQNIQTPSPDAFRASQAQIHSAALTQVSVSARRMGR
jgi:Lambda phage tail tape-measure protein (Tape_meas_lam_C)